LAAAIRTSGAAVSDADIGLNRRLFSDACRFEFFQAVRLLERLYPTRKRVGRHKPAAGENDEEVVRFRSRQSLEFAASEVHELEKADSDGQDTMWVNFMGLSGVQGAMPRYFAALLADPATRSQTAALAEFLDVFNHRLVSLFYRAWEKYRFAVAYEREGGKGKDAADAFSNYLYCFIGLGTPGLRGRLHIDDHILLYYAGLLAQRPRSAVALEGILEDYFGVPVQVVQFQGEWFEMNEDLLSSLGADGHNHELGATAVLWERIFDPQSRFRINVGPLTYGQFRDFLPGADGYVHLLELTRFFVGEDVNFEVRPMLKRQDVPFCVLGTDASVRLGWSMWLKEHEFDEDVAQPVFGARLAAS
jgi:type VI secretion system protein ImpH